MISIIAKFIVAEGKSGEFLVLAKELVDATDKEPGCIAYILNQNVSNASEYIMIEQWQDQAAVDAHNTSDHFTTIVPKILDISEISVDVCQPV